MSATNLGIGLPFGLYHGIDTTLLGNAMPSVIRMKYGTPIEVKNEEELVNYPTHNLIPGDTVYVRNLSKSETYSGVPSAYFIWNNSKWNILGMPTSGEFLNIYALNIDEEHRCGSTQFFMRLQTRNIQSNIKTISLLNGNLFVRNNEIETFVGVNGEYDFTINSSVNCLFTNLLALNLSNGLNYLMRTLCVKYNVPYVIFTDLYESTLRSLVKVISDTSYSFIQLGNQTTASVDISMYIHYIAATFATFKYIFTDKYNNLTPDASLDPTTELRTIDDLLVNRMKSNSSLGTFFIELLQVINDTIYKDDDNEEVYDFYKQLKYIIQYFTSKNTKLLPIRNNRNQLFTDLCEGIGGIISLALFFTILSCGAMNSITTIDFHFLMPKKYMDVV